MRSYGAEVNIYEWSENYQADYGRLIKAIPNFDYYLYMGLDEGSLGTLDALAAGIPTIISKEGFHMDLGIPSDLLFIEYYELRAIFQQIKEKINSRVQSVKSLTWEEYAKKHITIWKSLLKGEEININKNDTIKYPNTEYEKKSFLDKSIFIKANQKADRGFLGKIIDRIFYDNWVRSGHAPGPIYRKIISKACRSRMARVWRSHPLEDGKIFCERSSSFSFARNSLIWLFARMQQSKPQSILELGTGISTLAHAIYSKESRKPVSITSIDHDAGWLEVTRNMLLKRDRLENLVEFHHCNIIESNTRWGQGYELPNKLNDYYDWVLIDGPPARYGRSFTLPSIWDRLPQGANIFLDDADREGERKSTAEWLSAYPDLQLKGVLPLNKGLAWFQKCK